jgi:hypothetical protein
MASQTPTTTVEEPRVSSSEGNNTHEKISPAPSYEVDKGTSDVRGADVKYGTDVVEEKDNGESVASEAGERAVDDRGRLHKIWDKYKHFFLAFFMFVMTG